MSKTTGHKVKDYDATKDIVTCISCDFIGSAEEFHFHRYKASGGKSNVGTLAFLKDIPKHRFDYPKQGSLTGTGKKYGR